MLVVDQQPGHQQTSPLFISSTINYPKLLLGANECTYSFFISTEPNEKEGVGGMVTLAVVYYNYFVCVQS